MIRTSIFFTAATLVTLSSAINLNLMYPWRADMSDCPPGQFNMEGEGPCLPFDHKFVGKDGKLVNGGKGTGAQENARWHATFPGLPEAWINDDEPMNGRTAEDEKLY